MRLEWAYILVKGNMSVNNNAGAGAAANNIGKKVIKIVLHLLTA